MTESKPQAQVSFALPPKLHLTQLQHSEQHASLPKGCRPKKALLASEGSRGLGTPRLEAGSLGLVQLGASDACGAGEPWSAQEHLQFLEGLRHFGKGNWKQISKVYVPTRTPTQVASHAQKHFLRVSHTKAGRRRSRFTAIEETSMVASVAAVATRGGAATSHRALVPPPVLPMPTPTLRTVRPLRPPPPGPDGVALGIPVSVLSALPPPAFGGGRELPILPVMPGRIKAVMTHHQSPAPSTGSDSERAAAASSEPSSGGQGLSAARMLSAGSAPGGRAAAVAAASRAVSPKAGPPARGLQLLKLLELKQRMDDEQHQQQQVHSQAATAAGSGPVSAPLGTQAPSSASHNQRLPSGGHSSSGSGLDALAIIAEAEAVSKPALRPLIATVGPAPLPLQLPLTPVRPVLRPPPLPVVLEQRHLPLPALLQHTQPQPQQLLLHPHLHAQQLFTVRPWGPQPPTPLLLPPASASPAAGRAPAKPTATVQPAPAGTATLALHTADAAPHATAEAEAAATVAQLSHHSATSRQ